MTQRTAIEERLVRTLKRAGELAVPDDALERAWDPGDETRVTRVDDDTQPTGQRRWRVGWVVATAAAVLVAIAVVVGTLALPGSPPATRTALPAEQGSQLLCEANHCHNLGPGPSGANVSGAEASPEFGTLEKPSTPTSVWVVSIKGRLPATLRGAGLPGTRGSRPRGVLYLLASNRTYYRFVTNAKVGQLTVVSRSPSTVTLRAADGTRYRLDLRTNELNRE